MFPSIQTTQTTKTSHEISSTKLETRLSTPDYISLVNAKLGPSSKLMWHTIDFCKRSYTLNHMHVLERGMTRGLAEGYIRFIHNNKKEGFNDVKLNSFVKAEKEKVEIKVAETIKSDDNRARLLNVALDKEYVGDIHFNKSHLSAKHMDSLILKSSTKNDHEYVVNSVIGELVCEMLEENVGEGLKAVEGEIISTTDAHIINLDSKLCNLSLKELQEELRTSRNKYNVSDVTISERLAEIHVPDALKGVRGALRKRALVEMIIEGRNNVGKGHNSDKTEVKALAEETNETILVRPWDRTKRTGSIASASTQQEQPKTAASRIAKIRERKTRKQHRANLINKLEFEHNFNESGRVHALNLQSLNETSGTLGAPALVKSERCSNEIADNGGAVLAEDEDEDVDLLNARRGVSFSEVSEIDAVDVNVGVGSDGVLFDSVSGSGSDSERLNNDVMCPSPSSSSSKQKVEVDRERNEGLGSGSSSGEDEDEVECQDGRLGSGYEIEKEEFEDYNVETDEIEAASFGIKDLDKLFTYGVSLSLFEFGGVNLEEHGFVESENCEVEVGGGFDYLGNRKAVIISKDDAKVNGLENHNQNDLISSSTLNNKDAGSIGENENENESISHLEVTQTISDSDYMLLELQVATLKAVLLHELKTEFRIQVMNYDDIGVDVNVNVIDHASPELALVQGTECLYFDVNARKFVNVVIAKVHADEHEVYYTVVYLEGEMKGREKQTTRSRLSGSLEQEEAELKLGEEDGEREEGTSANVDVNSVLPSSLEENVAVAPTFEIQTNTKQAQSIQPQTTTPTTVIHPVVSATNESADALPPITSPTPMQAKSNILKSLWEKYQDDDGYDYFYNSQTGESTYDDVNGDDNEEGEEGDDDEDRSENESERKSDNEGERENESGNERESEGLQQLMFLQFCALCIQRTWRGKITRWKLLSQRMNSA